MKLIRKLFLVILTIFATLALSAPVKAEGENVVTVHFFHLITCVNCRAEGLALDEILTRYDNIIVVRYEVSDPANAELFEAVKTAFGDQSGTPYTVIGGVALTGYNDQTKRDIESLISRYQTMAHTDVVQKIIDGEAVLPDDFDDFGYDPGDVIHLPIIGEVAIDDLSIGIAAIVIGIVDGFNPCAMWVLLFLITMLANMGNRKRMWWLGFAFLFASGAMYFLFMAAWLNVALTITAVVWIRILIGVVAFAFGGWNLWRFFRKVKTKAEGCEVTGIEKKRKIVDRIRTIVREKSFLVALVGIVALAISVNFVELACSAGLPLLFTQILAYNDLPATAYYAFIGLYIFFFLIDDIIVFAAAMITMRVTGVSSRYAKWSTLVGGVIMLALGILLVFFPEIVMFNF